MLITNRTTNLTSPLNTLSQLTALSLGCSLQGVHLRSVTQHSHMSAPVPFKKNIKTKGPSWNSSGTAWPQCSASASVLKPPRRWICCCFLWPLSSPEPHSFIWFFSFYSLSVIHSLLHINIRTKTTEMTSSAFKISTEIWAGSHPQVVLSVRSVVSSVSNSHPIWFT